MTGLLGCRGVRTRTFRPNRGVFLWQTLTGQDIKGTHYTVENGERVVMPAVVQAMQTDET